MADAFHRFRLTQWIAHHLPLPAAGRLAECVSDLQWRLSSTDRAAVCENLRRITGRDIDERSPLVRDVFRHFGWYLIEFLDMPRLQQRGLIVADLDELADRLRPFRSGIIFSAHLGNWELGAAAIRGLGLPTSVVALRHEDARLDRLFNEQRARCGVGVIPSDVSSTRESLGLLRRGGWLAMLGDRDFGATGVEVDWFGGRARLPRGPALLSLRTGAPVVPVFMIREGPGRFRLHSEPAILPQSGAPPQAIRDLTQRYARVLESYIRRYPTQWLVMQPMLDAPARPRAAIADSQ